MQHAARATFLALALCVLCTSLCVEAANLPEVEEGMHLGEAAGRQQVTIVGPDALVKQVPSVLCGVWRAKGLCDSAAYVRKSCKAMCTASKTKQGVTTKRKAQAASLIPGAVKRLLGLAKYGFMTIRSKGRECGVLHFNCGSHVGAWPVWQRIYNQGLLPATRRVFGNKKKMARGDCKKLIEPLGSGRRPEVHACKVALKAVTGHKWIHVKDAKKKAMGFVVGYSLNFRGMTKFSLCETMITKNLLKYNRGASQRCTVVKKHTARHVAMKISFVSVSMTYLGRRGVNSLRANPHGSVPCPCRDIGWHGRKLENDRKRQGVRCRDRKPKHCLHHSARHLNCRGGWARHNCCSTCRKMYSMCNAHPLTKACRFRKFTDKLGVKTYMNEPMKSLMGIWKQALGSL